jgi:hypothetical protein
MHAPHRTAGVGGDIHSVCMQDDASQATGKHAQQQKLKKTSRWNAKTTFDFPMPRHCIRASRSRSRDRKRETKYRHGQYQHNISLTRSTTTGSHGGETPPTSNPRTPTSIFVVQSGHPWFAVTHTRTAAHRHGGRPHVVLHTSQAAPGASRSFARSYRRTERPHYGTTHIRPEAGLCAQLPQKWHGAMWPMPTPNQR